MRTRASVLLAVSGPLFIVTFSAPSGAFAQNGGYTRFPAQSAQSCAMACTSDQMCASWSFGNNPRSFGQNETRNQSAPTSSGMCSFSSSSTQQNGPGIASGLPRRDRAVESMKALNSTQTSQIATNAPAYRSAPTMAGQENSGRTGWEVRPAPWLSNTPTAAAYQAPNVSQRQVQNQSRPPAQPQPQPQSYAPATVAVNTPRIEYEAAPAQSPSVNRPVILTPPPAPLSTPRVRTSYSGTAPSSVGQSTQSLPRPSQPMTQARPSSAASVSPGVPAQRVRPLTVPPPPPRTQEIPAQSQVIVALPRAASQQPSPAPRRAVTLPPPAPIAPVRAATVARAATATSTAIRTPIKPVPVATQAAVAPALVTPSQQGAPPRQEVAIVPSPTRAATRGPVRDPSNPESFRGADGMIDAAEMRRAQLIAAREQGTPAYSVQREWEAVAAEQQRAEAAGEVRVDPLAGTAPVPPPPETRGERRAREAAEAAEDAAALARAVANGETDSEESQRPATNQRTRAAPRPARQTSSATPTQPRQTAQSTSRRQRAAAPQAIDREPRLSGGPG